MEDHPGQSWRNMTTFTTKDTEAKVHQFGLLASEELQGRPVHTLTPPPGLPPPNPSRQT